MSNSFCEDEIRCFLYSLKFDKYETEVYITLLKYGPQNYKGLVKLSGVAFGKIYSTLNLLIKKGWIEHFDQKPRVFYVRDPEEPLMNYLRTVMKQLTDLEGSILRILPQLKTLHRAS